VLAGWSLLMSYIWLQMALVVFLTFLGIAPGVGDSPQGQAFFWTFGIVWMLGDSLCLDFLHMGIDCLDYGQFLVGVFLFLLLSLLPVVVRRKRVTGDLAG
jgi:hypothetical protein